MKRDLSGAVSQIAAFLEVKLASDARRRMNDGTANYSWWSEFQQKGATKFMHKGVFLSCRRHWIRVQIDWRVCMIDNSYS